MRLNWRQRGSIGLIAAVFLITFYHILPTLIYYTKPLDQPLSEQQAAHFYDYQVAHLLEQQKLQIDWLKGLCRNCKLSAKIEPSNQQPQLIELRFTDSADKATFERYLPAALSLAAPAVQRLWTIPNPDPHLSWVVRPLTWSAEDLRQLKLSHSSGQDLLYEQTRKQWVDQVCQALQADPHYDSSATFELLHNERSDSLTHFVEQSGDEGLGARYGERKLQFLLQAEPKTALKQLQLKLSQASLEIPNLARAKEWLQQAASKRGDSHLLPPGEIAQQIDLNHPFNLPFTHPLIAALTFDGGQLELELHRDLLELLGSSSDPAAKERLTAKLYHLVAYLQQAGLGQGQCKVQSVALTLPENHPFQLIELQSLFEREIAYLEKLFQLWKPRHPLLKSDQLKLISAEHYLDPSTPPEDKLTCLIVDAQGKLPLSTRTPFEGPRVIFKGFSLIEELGRQTEAERELKEDLESLSGLLLSRGYQLFTQPMAQPQLKGSLLFANLSPFDRLLEELKSWKPIGRAHLARFSLPLYADWARELNGREEEEHRELVRWYEDWRLASCDLNPLRQTLAVKPPAGLFWNNQKLSWRKLMRGDVKRVLKWGLDLSGGRTVRLAIYDSSQRRVTEGALLISARNELLQRINRLGVSEVAARVEGNYLVVDFPSSQGLSSKELLQATTLSFHLVNETFSSSASSLYEPAQEFLTQISSEALVRGCSDLKSLNEIARRLLTESDQPAAQKLLAAGLRIAPEGYQPSSQLDLTYSKVVPVKRERKQATPALMLVYHHWAAEGSDLGSVRAGYDPQHGNILTFEIKARGAHREHPQEDFWRWTSRFSQEQVAGTELEGATAGRGWRMAVVVNDEVISAPSLGSGLRESAMIWGQFSPRDVARLSADLKAGSLSFTPQILSEENISPELGQQDRQQGVTASLFALIAVITCMVSYYRFGGLIASLAVLFNLLIVWAVLQNLGAALTLPGLAGIVLTVGMAVDANVLVFERVREELKSGSSLKQGIVAGYSRAFSAIIDSNLTTLLAALILIQFDSGPVKGFAITLIIGIASSMFTALFMTRTFFEQWASSSRASLKMADWIGKPKLAFLKLSRPFMLVCTLISILGTGLLWQGRHQILGIDFVGGYSFTLSASKAQLIEALHQLQIEPTAINARELGQTGRVKIYLSHSLNQPGGPWHGLQEEGQRLDWLKQHLGPQLDLKPQQLEQIESSWSSVSGQLSHSMRAQAAVALLLALLGILVYLAFRFEWLFALAAVLALAFDVATSIAAIGWLRALGVPMQIDLQAVGALMTLVGYALNDKIIVFDRIREELAQKRSSLSSSLIESALSSTLSRTLMTSGTTLLVLLVLDLMGGASLLCFSMIMTLGVVIGTLSSLFVAPAILLALSESRNSALSR